jgi:hypothetical protein
MPRIRARKSQIPKEDLDALLFEILSNIAKILVSTGYGFSRVNELTKAAFVDAARAIDPDTKPKLSIARIAALTGLTRSDVSQMVRPRNRQRHSRIRPTTRVARVAMGWSTDKRYSLKLAGPRNLKFAGAGNTFSRLVRQYSGDIPPKAMLKEMSRLGLVRQDKSGCLVLLRSDVAQSRMSTNALKAVIPWVGFLARASTARVNEELTSFFKRIDLRFSSLPQIYAATRELRRRHAAFVTALEQLGQPLGGNGRYALDVSVAIAATNPRVSKSPKARLVRKR